MSTRSKSCVPEPLNITPSFARDAAHSLHDENFQHALALCLAGTKMFPHYATGHLMLGKCYEALHRTAESLAAYRAALHILPDNAALLSFVQRAAEKLQQEVEKAAREEEAKVAAKKEPPPVVQLPVQDHPTNESAIDYLAKRLQDVKRIQPVQQKEVSGSTRRDEGQGVKFVTVTMAEIYIEQKQFAEAIGAYNELARRHPEEAEKFRKRISEIEQFERQAKRTDEAENKKAS